MARTREETQDRAADPTRTIAGDESGAAPQGHGSDTGAPGRDPDKPMSDLQRKYLEPLAESQDEDIRNDMERSRSRKHHRSAAGKRGSRLLISRAGDDLPAVPRDRPLT